jgi:predicted ATPase
VPVVRAIDRLRFEAPVTFLVGENGSGKSTVLEALAIAAKAVTAGAEDAATDASLAGVRTLAGALRLSWTARTHRGFYLRAEDFFGYAKRVARMRSELAADLAAVDAEYAGRAGSLAHELARTPFLRELAAIEERYGDGLDAQSHGESFLRFFAARLVPRGTYFLDEPEAPLSPGRQLSLLALLREMTEADCQLVIATHSPILLALPDSAIWSFDEVPPRAVRWEDLEHVRLTRDFLANPAAFLRYL